ncbi:hypothetical protein IF1G_10443 [Cordyceps javanica]|uniref:Uncharacterized protein n=1 Tax=Cordyceps javanica TaxID=43265 RepID=A0A545VLR0_9HYPO|nr:hypothetical protein IF1G_10443 [Cordyceps javanica]TQW02668.1 hypothetical protein IF2G_09835 [Cordyceps javanica]
MVVVTRVPRSTVPPRRSVDGIVIIGDSEDEAFASANEEEFPCIQCMESAAVNMKLSCVPTNTGTYTNCRKKKKKTCAYDSVLFTSNACLRYAAKRVRVLIDKEKTVATPASGQPRQKGYKFPVGTTEFGKAIR